MHPWRQRFRCRRHDPLVCFLSGVVSWAPHHALLQAAEVAEAKGGSDCDHNTARALSACHMSVPAALTNTESPLSRGMADNACDPNNREESSSKCSEVLIEPPCVASARPNDERVLERKHPRREPFGIVLKSPRPPQAFRRSLRRGVAVNPEDNQNSASY